MAESLSVLLTWLSESQSSHSHHSRVGESPLPVVARIFWTKQEETELIKKLILCTGRRTFDWGSALPKGVEEEEEEGTTIVDSSANTAGSKAKMTAVLVAQIVAQPQLTVFLKSLSPSGYVFQALGEQILSGWWVRRSQHVLGGKVVCHNLVLAPAAAFAASPLLQSLGKGPIGPNILFKRFPVTQIPTGGQPPDGGAEGELWTSVVHGLSYSWIDTTQALDALQQVLEDTTSSRTENVTSSDPTSVMVLARRCDYLLRDRSAPCVTPVEVPILVMEFFPSRV
jgi:hypothetical protein